MGHEVVKVHIYVSYVKLEQTFVCLVANALTNEAKIAAFAKLVACAKALAFILITRTDQ